MLPTGGGIAYGGFEIDHDHARLSCFITSREIPDALTRGSAMVTLWEDMLDGRAKPVAVVEQSDRGCCRGERDELNLQRMLGYIEQGFWRFVSTTERDGADAAARARASRRPGRGNDVND